MLPPDSNGGGCLCNVCRGDGAFDNPNIPGFSTVTKKKQDKPHRKLSRLHLKPTMMTTMRMRAGAATELNRLHIIAAAEESLVNKQAS